MTQLYITNIPAKRNVLERLLECHGLEAAATLYPEAAQALLSTALGDLAPSNFLWTHNTGINAYFDTPAERLLDEARRRLSPHKMEQWGLIDIKSEATPNPWRTSHPYEFVMRVPPIRHVHAPAIGNRTDVEIVASRDEAYEKWLAERIASWECADLDFAWMVGYQPGSTTGPRSRQPKPGAAAYVRGEITVTNPEKFSEMLRHGIGRQRRHGYGTMLVGQHCEILT